MCVSSLTRLHLHIDSEFQEALLFSSVLDGKRGIYGLAQTSLSFTGFTDEPHFIPPWQSDSTHEIPTQSYCTEIFWRSACFMWMLLLIVDLPSRALVFPHRSLSAGFTSGALSRTCTHPMERASLVMRASTDGAGLATVVKRNNSGE